MLCRSLAIATLALAGCRTTRAPSEPLPENFPNHSVSQIVGYVAAAVPSVDALRSRVRLDIQSPDFSGRVSGDIRLRVGDSLFVSASPGFGIDAAHALVTPDSFFVQDRIRNVFYYGDAEAAAARIPGYDGLGSVRDNLIGALIPAPNVAWTLAADDDSYTLTTSDARLSVQIDPLYWRVTRLVQRAADGSRLEERVFDDFGDVDGVLVPRRVRLARPAEDLAVTITHRDLDLAPQRLTFPFRARSSAEKRRIQ